MLEKLTALMATDERVYVLTADTGFHIFDELQQEYPSRYLNVGLCEATMIGMAAGLSHEGKRVFVYAIAPFATMRSFEQIRVDLCYPCLPATVIGVGGGLTYGPAGPTHHTIEDIAVMAALPNMTVVCPGDPWESGAAIEACMTWDRPVYLRLGKTGEPTIHDGVPPGFAFGRGIEVCRGEDVAIIATGGILAEAVESASVLAGRGISATVISMHTVKPIDEELVVRAAQEHRALVTVEEHSRIGGLADAVDRVLVDRGVSVPRVVCSLPDAYEKAAGSQAYLREKHGLTAWAIAAKAEEQTRAAR